MKKVISLLLVVLMLSMGFIACAGSEVKKAAGRYVGECYFRTEEPDKPIYDASIIYSTIQLKSNGKMEHVYDGYTLAGRWELDGENITITETAYRLYSLSGSSETDDTSTEITYTGTLVDGKLTISDSYATYIFNKQ